MVEAPSTPVRDTFTPLAIMLPTAFTALTAAIFLHEGLSTAFAVAVILMFVTLRDAVGVRLAAGEQARVVNELVVKLNLEHPALHVDHGHTTAQVIVGTGVGLVSAVIVMGLL